jgi:hypothetical protein
MMARVVRRLSPACLREGMGEETTFLCGPTLAHAGGGGEG